jgi:hypothetical protein
VRLLAAMTNGALAITAARTPMLAWHRDVAKGVVPRELAQMAKAVVSRCAVSAHSESREW